jgi:hypothetical protein
MAEENGEIVRGARITLAPLGEAASRRRSLDERLFVRVPALFHVVSAALMRLPPRSGIRRSLVARRIGRAYAAANRRAVSQPVFQLFKVRKGLVVWQHDFRDRADAVAAARASR